MNGKTQGIQGQKQPKQVKHPEATQEPQVKPPLADKLSFEKSIKGLSDDKLVLVKKLLDKRGNLDEAAIRLIETQGTVGLSSMAPVSLGERHSGESILKAAAPEPTLATSGKIEALVNQVADHMDVIKSNHQNEVIIKVKEHILPNTEVRITKTHDNLNIVFNTAASSLQLLHQNRDHLHRLLKRRVQAGHIQINIQAQKVKGTVTHREVHH